MPETSSKTKIGLGSKVKLHNSSIKSDFVYELVGQNEANPSSGKISIQSPLGIAMMNKKKDEEFTFETPSGDHLYKVIEII
jgi:transcription elongation factor GreA